MLRHELRRHCSKELPGAIRVARCDRAPHLVDFTQKVSVELEMGQQDGNAGFRHGRLLSREIGKLARDRVEIASKRSIRPSSGVVATSANIRSSAGVVAVHERDAEKRSHVPSIRWTVRTVFSIGCEPRMPAG
jgi:hypothetical protein